MFDVAPTELLLVAIVALVVIGPKDLPKAMRFVGKWVGRARGMARHFREGVDEMIRQSELQEMEQKWRAENERIMREHPMVEAFPADPAKPAMAPLPAPEATDEAVAGTVPRPQDESETHALVEHAASSGDEGSGTPDQVRGDERKIVEEDVELPLGLPPAPRAAS